jgi:D-aspartate ligase
VPIETRKQLGRVGVTPAPVQVEAALDLAAKRGRPPAVVAGDLTLVRPLGWRGVPIIAVTTDLADPVLRSRYVHGHCLVPGFGPAHEEETAHVLAELGERLCRLFGRPVPLFYGQDNQLELLYHHRELLERVFLFLLNDEPLAWALHDKAGFFAACSAAGVSVPPTVVPKEGEDTQALETALAALMPPLVIKPRSKSDWKDLQTSLFDGKAKARVFASAAELVNHPGVAEARGRLIVQEYVDAPVTSLCSFHGLAGPDRRLLAWFCGRKLRTYPAVAGESAFLELVHDRAIEEAGQDVARRLGLRGPFKIDLIRDAASGRIYTLEVNARFNLWHHLGAAHGVNLPWLAYELLVDGRVPLQSPAYVPRSHWMNFYRDLQAFRADPRLSARRWLSSALGLRTLHETFAWDDPLPFLAWAGRAVWSHGRIA